MKSFAVIALIANVSALSLRQADAPDPMPSAAAFSYNERAPAAAGFIQTQTSCQASGVTGVRCMGNQELFATGMNGDEDLGQDITMKGEKFHYNQKNLVQFATGMNGDEDLGQDITMKGEKFHYGQKSLVQFATGMNGDEDLGQDITMKGEKFHYNQAPADGKLFATGMNGDEDLGQDITMKGEKFHYAQQ